MSNRRAIVYLLLALVLAIAANLYLDLTGSDRAEVVRRRSLLRSADTAVAFEISGPGRATCRLEKTDRWRITQPFRASADQAAVARLVDALAFVPVTDSTDMNKVRGTPAEFDLEQPRLAIKMITLAGEETVSFGGLTPPGDGVYAMVKGFPMVYVVPNEVFAAANLSLDSWRRRTVFRISPDEVLSVDIRRGESAPVRIVRDGERWEVTEPRNAMASLAALKRIVDNVLACEAQKFVWPTGATNESATASVALLAGYGLDPETCETIVFRTADGRDHQISFGSNAESNSVYALIQDRSAIATVSAAAKESVAVDAETLIDGRLFPLEKTAVQRISILDGETAYLLARGENGLWRLDSPVAAAADDEAVSAMIDKLLVMRTADIEADGVKVSLAQDAPAVAVAKEAFLGKDGFEQLRSKTVLDIDPATVKRLVATPEGAAKPESVVYDPDRKGWNVETSAKEGAIEPKRLADLLAALSPLKAKAVARLKVTPGELVDYGLETPSFTLAVDRLLEGSVRRNILLGKSLNEQGDTYATVGSSDAVFVLDGATVKTLTAGVIE